MNEKEKNFLVRECLESYYKEDKKILIDISVLKITCITYLLYNNIFFGNRILISKVTLEKIKEKSKHSFSTTQSEIAVKNAKYLLESIKRDTRGNYEIIDIKGYKDNKIQSIKKFLFNNPDTIFYLSDLFLYQSLMENELKRQVELLEMGIRDVNPFRSKIFKFETIGAIRFRDGKMYIFKKEGVLIKIFNKTCIEKEENQEVKPRDYVLIRGEKDNKYSFNLYQVISYHTRNHAIRIIWTDLEKGKKSNKYIERLPYNYKKIIEDNV